MSSGKRGRPRNHGRKSSANQVRVDDDLAVMIGWICEVRNVTTAALVSPLIRKQVEEMYTESYPIIKKLKAAHDELARLKNEEPGPELPDLVVHFVGGEATSLSELHMTQAEMDADQKASEKAAPNLLGKASKKTKK